MFFKIVNPQNLQIDSHYEADSPVQFGGPWGSFPHIAVPDGMDPDCVKAESHQETVTIVDVPESLDEQGNTVPAVTHDEQKTVYTLVVDADKVAAKAQQAKVDQVKAAGAQMWADVLAQMEAVYGTKDMNSATANYLTWQDMIANENDYIDPELGFLDGTAVRIFAEAKLAQARVYAKWRSIRIKQFEIAKNAILGV